MRDRVRRFCDEEVRPVINGYWERAEFPFALLPKLAELGVCGGTIQGYGCPGLSPLGSGLVAMELARGDGSISTFHGVQSGLAMNTIALLGSEEQKRALPAAAGAPGRDRRLRADRAGSRLRRGGARDAGAQPGRRLRDRRGEALDRERRLRRPTSSCGPGTPRTRSGPTSSRRARPGFEARPITGKIAKRASSQADVTLTDVRVPAENKLAGAHSFDDAARVLTAARPNIAWGRSAMRWRPTTRRWPTRSERESFGGPIAGMQLVQYRLAKMLADLTAMRLVCLRLAELGAAGAVTAPMASMAKMHNAEHAPAGRGRGPRPPGRQRDPARERGGPAPGRRGGRLHGRGHRHGPRADRRTGDHRGSRRSPSPPRTGSVSKTVRGGSVPRGFE